jgi:acyl-coenzyme A thioesterase PaaI-like protein
MSPKRHPRVWSERRTKWVLNLYPPFFFNRIRVLEVAPGCRSARVRVKKSLLTRNLQGTTFGGTIFSAADPIHAILLWQVLAREGWTVQAWLRTARIHYTRAAASDLTLDFEISDADVHDAMVALNQKGRFSRTFKTEAFDRQGRVCAEVETEVYLRVPRTEQKEASAF